MGKGWFSPTCLHFLHLIAFTGVAALGSRQRLSGPANQITAEAQTLCPLAHWHIAVAVSVALVAEDVVPSHAITLGIKLHHCLSAWWCKWG